MKTRKSGFQFPINLVSTLALALLLQSCATMFAQDPDDMDASNDSTPYSQSAPAQTFQGRVTRAIRTQDIVLGMSPQDVLAAWGRPRDVQVAGDRSYGNERWLYYSSNSRFYGLDRPRVIYFEGGRVVGWGSDGNSGKGM